MADTTAQRLAETYAAELRDSSGRWTQHPEIMSIIDLDAGYGVDASEHSPIVTVRCPGGARGRDGHPILDVRLSAYDNDGFNLRVVPATGGRRGSRGGRPVATRANPVDATSGGPPGGGYWDVCRDESCEAVIPSGMVTCPDHGSEFANEINGRTEFRCPSPKCTAVSLVRPAQLLNLYCVAVVLGKPFLLLPS